MSRPPPSLKGALHLVRDHQDLSCFCKSICSLFRTNIPPCCSESACHGLWQKFIALEISIYSLSSSLLLLSTRAHAWSIAGSATIRTYVHRANRVVTTGTFRAPYVCMRGRPAIKPSTQKLPLPKSDSLRTVLIPSPRTLKINYLKNLKSFS